MFDSSWPELIFVAALALVVIGPKDLPELFQIAGKFVNKFRRMYANLHGSMSQLQKEVNIVSGTAKAADEHWRNYLPEELKALPEDFRPGMISAEAYQERRAQIALAKQRAGQADKEAAE